MHVGFDLSGFYRVIDDRRHQEIERKKLQQPDDECHKKGIAQHLSNNGVIALSFAARN